MPQTPQLVWAAAAYSLAGWSQPAYGRAPGDDSLEDGTRACRIWGTVSRRRYVARGVPGGYRVWDNRGRRWWGDLYELCPDDLAAELNGQADQARITALMKRCRARKR
jgi:hypothetical protein